MNKALKVIGIAVVSVVALFAAIIAIVFSMTSGMTETADSFFNSVKNRDFAKARTFLAEEFRANTDDKALEAYLAKSALLNFKESSWNSRSVNNGRGELEGSVATESGGNVPIKLTFVKEADSWKIYSLQKPLAGIQSDEASASIPSRENQIALVKKSWHDFAVSVGERDMKHFHSTVSSAWKAEFSVEKFNEAFGSVLGGQLDFTVVDPMTPIFDAKPALDENGVLAIKGHYATTPKQLHFEQKFIYEGVSWKLVGFSFSTK